MDAQVQRAVKRSSRHRSDRLSPRDDVANHDRRIDRFKRRHQSLIVSDRNHGPVDDKAHVRDDPRGRRGDGFADVGSEVQSAMTR